MTAQDHVSPQQLAMFIPAHELVDSGNYNSMDLGHSVHLPKWADKMDLVKQNGLAESVKREGIERPASINQGKQYDWNSQTMVTSGKPEIGNGHHRIAAAYLNSPNSEVPVIHHDNPQDALRGGYPHQPWDDNPRSKEWKSRVNAVQPDAQRRAMAR